MSLRLFFLRQTVLYFAMTIALASCSFKNKETVTEPTIALSSTDSTTTTTTTVTTTSSTTTTTVPVAISGPLPLQSAMTLAITIPTTTFSNPFYVGNSGTPTIRVSGVNAGNRVRLYIWDLNVGVYTCVANSGEGVSTGSSIDITVSPGFTASGSFAIVPIADDGAGNDTGCPSVANYPAIPIVLYSYQGPPAAPTSLTLISPSGNTRASVITVRVGGVTSGNAVKIYSDNNCSTQIGSATASSSTVDITTTVNLPAGSNTIYANRTSAAGTSACSTATLTYTRATSISAPNSISLINNISSSDSVASPTLTVSGVVSGDTVELYTDSSCTTLVASGTASGTTIDLTTTNPLNDGTYNFYAKSKYTNTNVDTTTTVLSSSCSTAHVQYILSTYIASPTALSVVSPTVVPNLSVTPIIRVSGVSNGDTVYLFNDSSCTSLITSATATSSTVDILTSLPAGDATWDFYATRTNGNFHSPCSSATAQYIVDQGAFVSLEDIIGSSMEGSGSHNITVSLSSARSYAITVYFETTNSTAVLNTHHNLSSSSVVIPAGDTSASISYTALENADSSGDKLLQISLIGSNRATIYVSNKSMHRETIRDNDIALSETLKISSGWYHTCAIVTGGVLKCWGTTAGLGSEVSTPTVVDAGTSYADIAVGESHSCAITTAGTLKCWGGGNVQGETGNGTYATPHDMDLTDTYSSVAAGYRTTCAISTSNQLKCWGYLSTSGVSPQQTAVIVGSNYQKVSIGTSHVCALKIDGTVYCWGNNSYGQLGDGTNTTRLAPNTPASGTYTDISVGLLSTCAIKTDTSISCWGIVGLNSGTPVLSNTPYGLTGPDGYVKIRVLPKYSDNVDAKCAIKSNGDVFCSGALDSYLTGYAINNTWTDSFVKFFSPASDLTFGRYGIGCSVYQGLSYCFGTGAGSFLGLGYNSSEEAYFATPQEGPNVVTMTRPDSISNVSCGIDSSSQLRCWGSKTGQVNSSYNQSFFNRPHSYILDTGTTYSTIVSKSTASWLNYFCGITTTGQLKCWSGDTRQPTALDTDVTYSSQIEIFTNNGCAITASGQLKCWGDNSTACMVGIGCGQGSTNTPTVIDSGTSYALLGHGENYNRAYMCAITTSGALKCWGNTIATGTHQYASTSINDTPTLVDMGTQYSSIELGNTHACGITTTGVLKCWSGVNGNGELGTGDYNGYDYPQIIDSVNYLSVSIANYTTCGITSTYVLKCWGLNSTFGRVGQGTTTTDYPSPQVVDSGITYSKVQVGPNSICAITTSGVLKCWGANIGLGNRNTSYFLSPTEVNSGTTYSDVWVDKATAKAICARTTGGITQCWGTNSYSNNLGINFSESLPFNRPLGLE